MRPYLSRKERPPHYYSLRHTYYYLIPDWSLWGHLSLALPTEMIFHQLRSIHLDRLERDYSTELMLDALEIIIKWLQVSVSAVNATDKPLRLKIQFVSRDLVPSDRVTCTIASRVNFFDTKLSIKFTLKFDICVHRQLCEQYNQKKNKPNFFFIWLLLQSFTAP